MIPCIHGAGLLQSGLGGVWGLTASAYKKELYDTSNIEDGAEKRLRRAGMPLIPFAEVWHKVLGHLWLRLCEDSLSFVYLFDNLQRLATVVKYWFGDICSDSRC